MSSLTVKPFPQTIKSQRVHSVLAISFRLFFMMISLYVCIIDSFSVSLLSLTSLVFILIGLQQQVLGVLLAFGSSLGGNLKYADSCAPQKFQRHEPCLLQRAFRMIQLREKKGRDAIPGSNLKGATVEYANLPTSNLHSSALHTPTQLYTSNLR